MLHPAVPMSRYCRHSTPVHEFLSHVRLLTAVLFTTSRLQH